MADARNCGAARTVGRTRAAGRRLRRPLISERQHWRIQYEAAKTAAAGLARALDSYFDSRPATLTRTGQPQLGLTR
jgi:hypothetical protein